MTLLYSTLFLILVIFIVMLNTASVVTLDQCCYSMSDDFSKCNNRPDEEDTFRNARTNRIYNISEPSDSVCTGKTTCRRIFKLLKISRRTSGTKMTVQISNLLKRCCGNCSKYHIKYSDRPLSDLISDEATKNIDIIFPVPSTSANTKEMLGFHFIPVFDVPSAFYITHPVSNRERTVNMIKDCLANWPLLVICLLMSFIAGFIGWVLETWKNTEEFPRSFHVGLFEGFWWSFISMTTVGYGDKAPRSFFARLFAVLWILVGITISSMYIAKMSRSVMFTTS